MLAKYKHIKSFKIGGKSGQVKIDPGKSIFQLLTRLGEQGSILSVHTACDTSEPIAIRGKCYYFTWNCNQF